MLSLRKIINTLTFPGIVIHELAHKLYCDWTGTPVHKVRYLTFSDPMGYVVHSTPDNLSAAFAIAVGPLVVNTVFCSLSSFAACFVEPWSWGFVVLLWVGISAGMHAFPSNQDAKSFRECVRASRGKLSLLYFFSWFFFIFIRLVNISKYLWSDLLYTFIIASLLPIYFGYFKLPEIIQKITRIFFDNFPST